MNTKGIRIADLKNDKCIPLFEILREVPDPHDFYWLLLWFDVTPLDRQGEFIMKEIEKVNHSEKGVHYTFSSLMELSQKIFQEIELLIIGCKLQEDLHRYGEDQTMYETCDIVIEMIDGGCWEIFSKNTKWIDQLATKYKKTECLSTNFQID